MYFKFDKNVFMNFLHSFFGGIFGGIVIAFSLGQTPKIGSFGYYVIFLGFVLFLAMLGLFVMAFINNMWDESKRKKTITGLNPSGLRLIIYLRSMNELWRMRLYA